MNSVSSTIKEELKVAVNQTISANSAGWEHHGWFYIAVRTAMFLWVKLCPFTSMDSGFSQVVISSFESKITS